MAEYKQASKGPKRPSNRVMGSQFSGQRRANAIDDIVTRAQRGDTSRRHDELREGDVKRR